LHLLSAARQVQLPDRSAAVALHHFFEGEVMIKFSVTDQVQTPSLHLQKNVLPLFLRLDFFFSIEKEKGYFWQVRVH